MFTDAYRRTQAIAERPRAEEYRRLAEITSRLLLAENDGNAQLRAIALRENQRFWQGMQTSAMFPEELKGQFTALAGWVERESVLAALGEAKLEGLIAVNKQIMGGLQPHVVATQSA